VLQVRAQPATRPCLLQLELWQSNLLLAPACTVLLLPGSMAGVAAELQAGRGTAGGLNAGGFVEDFSLWCQAVHCMGNHGSSSTSATAAGSPDAVGARNEGE